jgi:putative integral membrane protein (TIGR02587 family)
MERSANRDFLVGLARAFAGALVFSLPLLMTMEMWFLGVSMSRGRLALLTASMLPLLVGLSHFIGFEETPQILDDVLDAAAAYGVACITSAAVLFALGVAGTGFRAGDLVGTVGLQAVPASIGALLAQSQLGPPNADNPELTRDRPYGGDLFIMAVGALFLAFNIAPTEEMMMIADKMTAWHAVALVVTSLLVMHAFVYGVEFSGTPLEPPGMPWWSLFARYALVGYALALVIALYVLWVFGRLDGLSIQQGLMMGVVLGFPGAVGAAAARLIL